MAAVSRIHELPPLPRLNARHLRAIDALRQRPRTSIELATIVGHHATNTINALRRRRLVRDTLVKSLMGYELSDAGRALTLFLEQLDHAS